MTDSQQMYNTLLTALTQNIPRSTYGDVRRLMVLAWAVVGLCISETVNFSKWGEVVISEAQNAASHQRRFQRFLKNKRIKPLKYYYPLLRAALSEWSLNDPIYVALDVSDLKNGYVLIRLALIYRGRAIPVSWRVMKHNSTSVAYRDYKILLKQALIVLPAEHQIILLADRGFVHHKLVKFCRRQQWQYRLRAKSTTLVRLPDRRVTNFGKLCPPPGEAHFYQAVHILGEEIGPVHLALANPPGDEKPWYVISDQPSSGFTLDEYGLRFDIEEGFLDDKSGGFQVESTKLDDPAAIERLFLVLAIATLHFTSVGVEVVNQQKRRWVDTHWDRGLSYFKIGWRWLRQQFRKNWPVFAPFKLDPAPDPDPAIASRRKAAAPKPLWLFSFFDTS